MLKLGRVLYKTMENLGLNKIIDILDDKVCFGEAINTASTEGMDEKPAWTMLGSLLASIAFLVVLLVGLVVLSVILVLLYFMVIHIPDAPAAIWIACMWVTAGILVGLTYIGFGLFMMFSSIGLIMQAICDAAVWLFTAGWLWLIILKWTGYIIAAVAVSFVLCFGIYKASTSKATVKLIDVLKFKLNGFAEAREKASDRRQRQRQDKVYHRQDKINKKREEREKRPPGICNEFCGKILEFTKAQLDKLFDIDIDIKGNTVKVLGPIGALGGFVMAAKKGVCPIVSFIDPDVLALAAVDVKFDPAKENALHYDELHYDLRNLRKRPKRSMKVRWICGEYSASIKSIVARLIMDQFTIDQAVEETVKSFNAIREHNKSK